MSSSSLAPSLARAPFTFALACVAATAAGCVPSEAPSATAPVTFSDGGVPPVDTRPDHAKVDCCQIDTKTQQQLCDDLYGGTVPSGLTIEDTCNAGTDTATDPCAGATGTNALACQLTAALSATTATPQAPADPCANLTGMQQLFCQLGGAAGLTGTTSGTGTGSTGGLADLANGLGALGDLGSLLGLGSGTGSTGTGNTGTGTGTTGTGATGNGQFGGTVN